MSVFFDLSSDLCENELLLIKSSSPHSWSPVNSERVPKIYSIETMSTVKHVVCISISQLTATSSTNAHTSLKWIPEVLP